MRLLAPLTALLLVAVTVPASAITIDNFNVNQTLFAGTGAVDTNTTVTGLNTDIVGTERDTRLNKTGTSSSFANVGAGLLTASMGPSSSGTITLQWDGTSDATKNNIAPTGLSPQDLTDAGSSNSISASITNGLTPVTMTFTVWGDGGSGTISSTQSVVIPASFSGSVPFLFTGFAPSINFTAATAIQMDLIIPQNGTMDVDLIETTFTATSNLAPEPGLLGMLAPLLFAGYIRRRRTNA